MATLPGTTEATTEAVKTVVTAASVINHLKANRLEYLLCVGLLHVLGVSDRILAQLNGVCF
jgi:hypothetical protein